MDRELPSNQEQEYEVLGILLESFDIDYLIEITEAVFGNVVHFADSLPIAWPLLKKMYRFL